MSFDIIGDIHGMLEPLEGLLKKMGYQYSQGSYRHPEGRTAIFVGDLIDRGVKGLDVIDIARSMTETGNAITVMGNHELNAILFKTEDRDGFPLRPHSEKNIKQHSSFLAQIAIDNCGQEKWDEAIEWFKTLPLFYENEHFRVIHACWHEKSLAIARKYLNPDNSLDATYFEKASREYEPLYIAIEKLLKGDEQSLPNKVFFKDKSGIKRSESRLRWWLDESATFKDLAMFQGSSQEIEKLTSQMPDTIPKDRVVYKSDKPVFIGHYWLNDEKPSFRSKHVCCVDYSAGKGDKLVAYRWSPDNLSDDNFIFWPNSRL